MNIGQAARASGVSSKMIRYYESIGLIPTAPRRDSGYRDYSETDVYNLSFIRRARDLGFSVEQMSDLLKLWHDRSRASADVKRIALHHVEELDRKALQIQQMSNTLRHLAENCHGDGRPFCPILEDLAEAIGGEAKPAGRPRFGAAGIEPDRTRRQSAAAAR